MAEEKRRGISEMADFHPIHHNKVDYDNDRGRSKDSEDTYPGLREMHERTSKALSGLVESVTFLEQRIDFILIPDQETETTNGEIPGKAGIPQSLAMYTIQNQLDRIQMVTNQLHTLISRVQI